jgi:hypothetical protein
MAYHVMQDWTATLPHRQQGVIVLALRGPDGSRKETATKVIVRALRACTMNNGETGEPMKPGDFLPHDSFMSMAEISDDDRWETATLNFLSEIDSLNIHYWQHLIHGAAVLGFNYPDLYIRSRWWEFYTRNCKKLHLTPETQDEFFYRLRSGRRPEAEDD